MGFKFTTNSMEFDLLETKVDSMKEKLQKKISRKIQFKLVEERAENFLLNLMFQHLTTNELLSCTLVSHKWNYNIGRLKTFHDRFLIKCPKENLIILDDSERYYRKIELKIGNSYQEIQGAEKIVLKFSPHLSSISLIKYGGHNSLLNHPLPFSKRLTKVELHAVCGRLSAGFLKYVKTLRNLIVNGVDPKGLTVCLTNNSKLTELTLYENSFVSYFENDISPLISFKLKKFALLDHLSTGLQLDGEYEAKLWTKSMLQNIVKFLRSQNQLKYLQLDKCLAVNIAYLVMPSLKILEIKSIKGNIEELDMSYNNVQVLLTNYATPILLAKFQELKYVFVRILSTDMLFIKDFNDHVEGIYFEEKEDDTLEWINENVIIKRMTKNEFTKMFCKYN